jgi:hypothetical protein
MAHQNKKPFSRQVHNIAKKARHVKSLIFVFIIAIIGAYFVYASRAATIPNIIVLGGGDSPDSYGSKVDPTSGSIDIYAASIPQYEDTGQTVWHVGVHIAAAAKITGYQCGAGFTCTLDYPIGSYYEGPYTPSSPWASGLYACVNLASQHYGGAATLFSIQIDPQTTYHIPKNDPNPSNWDDYVADARWMQGACIPGQDNYGTPTSGFSANRSTGAWGSGDSTAQGELPRDNSAPIEGQGNNNGEQGDGLGNGQKINNGTGASNSANSQSSSGGATSKKQSNQSNPLPNSGEQGNLEQINLEPSAFFDGKQFKSGSDTDNIAAAANGGLQDGRHGKSAIYVGATTLMLISGGLYLGYIRFKRK